MNFNNRTKLRMLYAMMALMLFIAYKFTFRKTIDLYKEVNSQMETINQFNNPDSIIQVYQKQLNMIKEYVKAEDTSMTNEQLLLQFLSDRIKSNNIQLLSFPASSYLDASGFAIQTNYIKLSGTFQNLLAVLYGIETEQRYYKVASAKFSIKKSINDDKGTLLAEIYVRAVNTINYEEN